MADSTFSPDEARGVMQPNPAGEAALLLVESLIHGLIGKSVLSVAEAIEIIDVAADVRSELAEERGEDGMERERSLMLLTALSNSLRFDVKG